MGNDCNQKKRILIVHDSRPNQQLISDLLGDTYEYLSADNGAQALEILKDSRTPDIILLDITTANMKDLELLETVNAQHWTDQIPVIILSSETNAEFLQKVYDMGAADHISSPFREVILRHRVENALKLYGRQNDLVSMVQEQVYEREKINSMLIHIFSHVIEMRNLESGNHTQHMQVITGMLLRRLVRVTSQYQLSEKDISMISTVAALHDIGKIVIPESILNKPDKLTPEERAIMETHTVVGDELLNRVSNVGDARYMAVGHEICRWHHERWDGSGYPDGLRGDEIPIAAQVVSIADVYDALTSERCYKKAYSHETALRMIGDGSCGAFNPVLVQCLQDIGEELRTRINLNMGVYDYVKAAQQMAQEMFNDGQHAQAEHSFNLAVFERIKKDFFAAQCGGVQFEYDNELKKLLYLRRYNRAGERIRVQSGNVRLLTDADGERLRRRVRAATRENPVVEMRIPILLDGQRRLQRLTVRTIWGDGVENYIGMVGQFSDLPEEAETEKDRT